jgi:hypothetical protein
MLGETGVTVVTTLVCFFHFAREAADALMHPAFPAPSDVGAKTLQAKLARCAARSRSCGCLKF